LIFSSSEHVNFNVWTGNWQNNISNCPLPIHEATLFDMELLHHDISTRRDIETLVSAFYGEVKDDAILGDLFNQQIGSDWSGHEERVCDFWETILLGTPKFKSRSLLGHLEVDELRPLCPFHFERWCQLFRGAVKNNFEGERANRALCRAEAMSAALQNQLSRERGCPLSALNI
jgi:hemoglobin